jgi:hypothetical protein
MKWMRTRIDSVSRSEKSMLSALNASRRISIALTRFCVSNRSRGRNSRHDRKRS